MIVRLEIEIPDDWEDGPRDIALDRVRNEILRPILRRGVSDIHPDLRVRTSTIETEEVSP